MSQRRALIPPSAAGSSYLQGIDLSGSPGGCVGIPVWAGIPLRCGEGAEHLGGGGEEQSLLGVHHARLRRPTQS
eukprot:3830546-Pyramimonas_sp.AAC.1